MANGVQMKEDIAKKIDNAIQKNKYLTISQLSKIINEPRGKVGSITELLEQQGVLIRIPVATGLVITKVVKQ